MNKTERFENILKGLQTELVERRARIDDHYKQGVPADFEDQATMRENDQTVDALSQQIDTELTQIEAALARIANGKFGICAACGSDIEERRLEAIPFTPMCSNCA